MIVPVFVALPTVSVLFPVAVIASLTVTAKLFAVPTTVKFPFASAAAMTEALIFAAPVTVNMLPLILQLVPEEGPLLPPEEIVRV